MTSRLSAFLRQQLRATHGAIDLISVMVGVIVIGIVSTALTATLFIAVPWGQDQTAQAAISNVVRAQGIYRATNPGAGYASSSQLAAQNLLPKGAPIAVVANANSDCYIAVSVSQSGKTFYDTNSANQPKEYTSGATTSCTGVDLAQTVQALVQAAGAS